MTINKKISDDIRKELQERFIENMFTDLAKVIKTHIKAAGISDMDSGNIIASIIGQFTNFNIQNSYRMEKVLQAYYGQLLFNMTDDINAFYNFLKENNYTEDNKFEGNGADRYCWYAENTTNKVIICQTQSWNYLVVIEDQYWGDQFHFRRWYPTYDGPEVVTLKKDNISVIHRISECADDSYNAYPERLSLDNYKEHNFEVDSNKANHGLRYGDLRDTGYIVSTDSNTPNRVDRIYENGWVQRVIDDLDAQIEIAIRNPEDEE